MELDLFDELRKECFNKAVDISLFKNPIFVWTNGSCRAWSDYANLSIPSLNNLFDNHVYHLCKQENKKYIVDIWIDEKRIKARINAISEDDAYNKVLNYIKTHNDIEIIE